MENYILCFLFCLSYILCCCIFLSFKRVCQTWHCNIPTEVNAESKIFFFNIKISFQWISSDYIEMLWYCVVNFHIFATLSSGTKPCCSDCLCNWCTFYWRCYKNDSIWRCGCYGCWRYRIQHWCFINSWFLQVRDLKLKYIHAISFCISTYCQWIIMMNFFFLLMCAT